MNEEFEIQMKNNGSNFQSRLVTVLASAVFMRRLLLPDTLRAGKSTAAARTRLFPSPLAVYDHQYNLAETNLVNFLATYTNSIHNNSAILYWLVRV